MDTPDAVLVADADAAFRERAVTCLKGDGRAADGAADAGEALGRLGKRDYDCLVCDVALPGGLAQRFLPDVAERWPAMPIVVVAGRPSVESAVQAIRLPVVSYLVKPVGDAELCGVIDDALQVRATLMGVGAMRERVAQWQWELTRLESIVRRASGTKPELSIQAFLDVAMRNVMGTMADVAKLTLALGSAGDELPPCRLLACPVRERLVAAVGDAIAVLEGTKSSFRSKELAQLRLRLEALLAGSEEDEVTQDFH